MFDANPTSWDLRWRMFGVSVAVRPWFWLLAAFLGWHWTDYGIAFLALWVACVFVSIVLHEFGHVLAFRWFGVDSSVVLYSFGGLAIPTHNPPYGWQRALVALAGPAAQLLLYAVLSPWGSLRPPNPRQFEQSTFAVAAALHMLVSINLIWALFNLVPIWPLDGGRISREACLGVSRANGVVWSLYLSIACAAVLALHSFLMTRGQQLIPFVPFGGFYSAIFFAMFTVESFQNLQLEKSRRRWDDDRLPWEQ